jgi:RNA polymerase sigma-70 factor (ECF subfamily)
MLRSATSLNQLNPNELLAEHGDYLYRYALARLRDPHLAEDAVQETLLAALQSKTSFSGKSSLRTWLTGILKHKIIDLIRRQSREAPLEEDVAAEEPGMDDYFLDDGHFVDAPQSLGEPGSLLQQNQFLEILQACLDRLPKKLARLFMLREVEEADNEEICKELKITPTNAWVMLYRARMGLRQCLQTNWLGGGRDAGL